MRVSLIVTTAPGREGNLACCLEQLTRQTHQQFEVIIVDDGSSQGYCVSQGFKKHLALTYSWRPNTCCVAYSRNQGAQLAEGSLLIFIDSDIVLNPRAVECYVDYFNQPSEHILYGYYGTLKHIKAPSLWFPHQWVHWMDERFVFESPEKIESPHDIFTTPYSYGWSGNFALLKSTYQKIGGFNEHLIGWGFEDIEFASRAIQQGCPIHFSLDSWGEHLVHALDERFHQVSKDWSIERKKRALSNKYKQALLPINYSLQLSDQNVDELVRLIFEYYYRQSRTVHSD